MTDGSLHFLMHRRHVTLDLLLGRADERAARASERVAVGQHVLGQVVLANESFVADGALEISGAVRGLVLAEGARLGESFAAECARERRFLGVRSVVGEQLGPVAEDLVAFAARLCALVVVAVVAQTGRIVELLVANFASCRILPGFGLCRLALSQRTYGDR